jgi:hypothetical protein
LPDRHDGLTLLRQRHWAHRIDWQADDLVPRLQDALREAAMARWPEAAPARGGLARLAGQQGGSDFSRFAAQWPLWLYGGRVPDEAQRKRLRLAYLAWGRRCVSAPRFPASKRAPPPEGTR